jgi:hypothetical protein
LELQVADDTQSRGGGFDIDSWDINEPQKFAPLFREAVERAEESADNVYLAELLTQLVGQMSRLMP